LSVLNFINTIVGMTMLQTRLMSGFSGLRGVAVTDEGKSHEALSGQRQNMFVILSRAKNPMAQPHPNVLLDSSLRSA
jgi:hypothetical protein